MVDEGRVTRLLRAINERIERLTVAAGVPEVERGPWWLDGVKYLLVTTIEGCVDVAHHIISSESFGSPDTNADALRRLGEHGVVDPDLARRLGRAVGFRNVLVHQYTQVDDDRVIAMLGELGDLRQFVAEVSAWLLAKRD